MKFISFFKFHSLAVLFVLYFLLDTNILYAEVTTTESESFTETTTETSNDITTEITSDAATDTTTLATPEQVLDDVENDPNVNCDYIFGIPPISIDPLIFPTTEDDDFENWVPPPKIQAHQHWTFSGFSPDNIPIWIRQFTNHDIGEVVHDKALNKLYLKATKQMGYIMRKSHFIKSTPEKPVNSHIWIFDFEGYNQFRSNSLANSSVVAFFRKRLSQRSKFVQKYVAKQIFVNMNFVSELVLNAYRIVNHRTLTRVEFYGTDRRLWTAALQKQFSRDQLPEKYGGFKGHISIPYYRQNDTCAWNNFSF